MSTKKSEDLGGNRERSTTGTEARASNQIDEAIQKTRERLVLLEAARRGHSLFRVTTSFEDYHSGREIVLTKDIWAATAEDAEREAAGSHAEVIGWTTRERGVPTALELAVDPSRFSPNHD